jgi:hypothetical protein
MRFAISLLALCLGTVPQISHAALSGYHDSAEQIQAILASPELADRLKQQPIESLEFDGSASDGTLEWEIETQDCDAHVYLRAIPPAGVGKTTYEVARISDCH